MKQKVKITIDILMILCLFILSGYQFFTQEVHEWLGMIMFILFIIHNVLNFHWYSKIIKGKYSIIRIIYLVINILVLISMLVQMYSGIVMSQYILTSLNIPGHISTVRKLHILGAYWGFILIGLHLGIHWSTLIKRIKIKKYLSINLSTLSFILSMIIALYGIYAFLKRDFLTYLFLKSEFVFMNFSEFQLFFYIDYLAIISLCVFIAHYGTKILLNKRRQYNDKKSNSNNSV